MDEIAKIILSAKRRRFLRSSLVFKRFAPVSEAELFRLAIGLNFKFTLPLSKWLLLAGYGDIDEVLSFREECFSLINGGAPDGYVSFAQDLAGNRYAFSPRNGAIYYVSHPKKDIVKISGDFPSFMQELIRRDYKLKDWMASITIPQ